MLEEYLKKCAVLGAGGKMGSGIALILLQEIARREQEQTGRLSGEARLFCVDTNEAALPGLRQYLKNQLVRYAEKNIVALRETYRERLDLMENRDIIDDFVQGALSLIRLETRLEPAAAARLVFEAVLEKVEVKARVFSALKKLCSPEAFFLTNTSSIPISVLEKEAGLEGRIIGCHFYNPAPVQRLLEVIPTPGTDQRLRDLAVELGKCLGKKIVPSQDVAGFIGNGHFMRDILFACRLVTELEEEHPQHEAIYLVNKVSQDFLLRPMGIFQLADYVGLDICGLIMSIMTRYIEEEILQSDLIDSMLAAGIKGGQNPDGSQKDGIFRYERGKPVEVYSLKQRGYLAIERDGWPGQCNAALGPLPEGHEPWKALVKDAAKEAKLKRYFQALFAAETLGAGLARRYLDEYRRIAEKLVADGIAGSMDDVNTVLQSGFYHLYGPGNDLY